jgi:hypothetical protein
LHGETIGESDHREIVAAWQAHSHHARRLFTSNEPERDFSAAAKALPLPNNEISNTGAAPPHFMVCQGSIMQVDALVLGRPEHTRYVHRLSRKGWQSKRVNP